MKRHLNLNIFVYFQVWEILDHNLGRTLTDKNAVVHFLHHPGVVVTELPHGSPEKHVTIGSLKETLEKRYPGLKNVFSRCAQKNAQCIAASTLVECIDFPPEAEVSISQLHHLEALIEYQVAVPKCSQMQPC